MLNERIKILDELRQSSLPVVICGAGIVGQNLLNICREAGVSVACFCDNSEKVAHSLFCGYEVLLTRALKERFDDAILLISVAAIKDVVDLVEGLGFKRWYAGGLLLKEIDTLQVEDGSAIDYEKFAIENCILCHKGYLHPDRLFMRSIDLIITERCSLKCRDCSNLMQYYEKPSDCSPELLRRSIDAFFTVVDDVMDFRVIGGDAFMGKNWISVVEYLHAFPAARRIVLYTNGTIVPDEAGLALLAEAGALVVVTDYGSLSRNLELLRKQLEKFSVSYHVLEVGEWLDCAAISPNNRTREQLSELFRNCCAKNMATLSDGKIFRCPYGANSHRLGAVPDVSSDYVNLFSGKPVQAIRDEVRNYLVNKEYLELCDFCNGRPLSGNELPPALQTDKPLPYKRYPRRDDNSL